MQAMLKISAEQQTQTATVLKLEGRLVGPWVDELRDVCGSLLEREPSVTLDLGHVTFVDRNGKKLLEDLQGRVALSRCSALVEQQLR